MRDRFRVRGWSVYDSGYYNDIQNMLFGEEDNMTLLDAISKGLVKEITPEQCTGLKDVNGKLIYEGDILQSTDGFFHQKYKVKWDQEFSQFTLIGINTINVAFGIIDPDSLEIIGNIHENPELMEEK